MLPEWILQVSAVDLISLNATLEDVFFIHEEEVVPAHRAAHERLGADIGTIRASLSVPRFALLQNCGLVLMGRNLIRSPLLYKLYVPTVKVHDIGAAHRAVPVHRSCGSWLAAVATIGAWAAPEGTRLRVKPHHVSLSMTQVLNHV